MPIGVYPRTEYHKEIMRKHHADFNGDKNPCWRGGKTKSVLGYVWVYAPDHPKAIHGKYVPEQVLVMEKLIGRYLTDDEVVHHINGKKNENDPENLALLTITEHKKLHRQVTKCLRGHPLAGPEADVYIDKRGHRFCRVCRRLREEAARAVED
jgi:hypothetical protein